MTQDEIIEMARFAGIRIDSFGFQGGFIEEFEAFANLVAAKAIAVEREALAQPEQEPVAWMHVQGNYKEPSFRELADDEVERGWEQYPLYNTTPQRSESSGKPSAWVGLEGEEIRNLWEEATKPDRSTMTMVTSFAKSIEAKLKDKNN